MKFFISNHIGIYDNALKQKDCEILIDQFEKSTTIIDGGIFMDGEFVKEHSHKKCKEIKDTHLEDKSIISNIIDVRIKQSMEKYKKQFPSVDKYLCDWKIDDGYNFQKYEAEDDGYKKWHCEQSGGPASHRLLAWMFYVNDAKCGTEFMDYGIVKAKRGRCVIWPAGWTHVHRGVIPNKGLKYIVTGWCSYLESK